MPRLHRWFIAALALALISPSTVAQASDAAVRRVPSSISADCSADVSKRLTRWFRSLPDGATAVLKERGCYRTEREIVLRDKNDFVLDGRGALLRRTTYTPPALRYPKSNGILRVANLVDSEIRNLRIRGTNTKSDLSYIPRGVGSYRQEVEFDAGLGLHSLLRTVVSDIRITGVWGDGIYLAGSDQWGARQSSQVVLRRITIAKNGRAGIAINRSHHILLDRVNVRLSRRSGINMEPDTKGETVHHIEIKNSTIGANLNAISAWGAGRVNQVDIHDNVIARTGVPWVYVSSYEGLARRDWTIRDNVVTWGLGSPVAAMAFWNTEGIVISGNRMSIATTQSQLAVGLFNGSSDARIECNAFLGARREFVAVEGGGTYVAAKNTVTPEPTGCAVSDLVRRRWTDVGIPRLAIGATTPLARYAKEKLGVASSGDTFDVPLQVAVQQLQKARGWPATGVIDRGEWRLIIKM